MARTFVVEAEPFARVANLVNAALHTDPARRISKPNARQRTSGRGPRQVSPGTFGPQRHGPKRVLDIGKNQFLVLLLVMNAQLDEAGGAALGELIKVPLHRVIHPGPV